jgi:glutamate synthase domain-containing protein 3
MLPSTGRRPGTPLSTASPGERFCVRNSGVRAVVEGVGDHGCEYMTGGEVIILGLTGRNFAAGMSGGVAYVLDLDGKFQTRLNRTWSTSTASSSVKSRDGIAVRKRIEEHVAHTDSARGKEILVQWTEMSPKFIKVLPRDYERMLNAFKKVEEQGLSGDEAAMAAFEENLRDLARVAGN